MNVLAIGDAQSKRIMGEMKLFYKKKNKQVVTIREFCDYKGLDIEDVCKIIKVVYWLKQA